METEIDKHLGMLSSKHTLDEAIMCNELSVDDEGNIGLPGVNNIVSFILQDKEMERKLYFLWLPYRETLSFVEVLILFAKECMDYSIYYSGDIIAKFSKFLWVYFEIPLGIEDFVKEVLGLPMYKTEVEDETDFTTWPSHYHYPTARKYINCELLRTYRNKR